MQFDTAVFDLDGTLLNTLDDLADSVNAILERHGYPVRTVDEVRRFVGNGVPLLIERAIPAGTGREEYERCLAEFKAYYQDHMCCKTGPYPGIPELLREMKARGVKMAVVSNKFDAAVKELCEKYYGGAITVAIGESAHVRKKPAPDSVWRALEELGARRDRALYIGDSDVDVQTARNAGLTSVGVTWGFRDRALLEREGARYLIDRPAQLLTILAGAGDAEESPGM